jgi:phosphatidylglycerophosphate synthase
MRTAGVADQPTASSASRGVTGQSERRPELNDWLNRRVYHPLAKRLTLALAPTSVTPNQLSVAGGFCVILAGACYVVIGNLAGALAGFGLHLAWHVLDGADGDLARLTGKASPFGEAIDGIADYFSHIVLYCMIGWMLMGDFGPAVLLAVVGAGVSRIFQASHLEERRREYEYWVYGRRWIRNSGIKPRTKRERGVAALVNLYLSVSDRTRDGGGTIESLHRQVADDEVALAQFRATARRHLAPLLGRLQLLGANQRTIILGILMVAGHPIGYFLYELSVLNLALLWSIRTHRKAAACMREDLVRDRTGKSAFS